MRILYVFGYVLNNFLEALLINYKFISLRLLNHIIFLSNQLFNHIFIPATRSRTATLLRLHTGYQSLRGFFIHKISNYELTFTQKFSNFQSERLKL
jgi:hypothetical protein